MFFSIESETFFLHQSFESTENTAGWGEGQDDRLFSNGIKVHCFQLNIHLSAGLEHFAG